MTEYHKHSLRQVQVPCDSCHTDKLYWAHELAGAPDPTSAHWCPKCEVSGPLVMVDMDTLKPHSCTPSPQVGNTGKPQKPGQQDMDEWEAELTGEKPKPSGSGPVMNDPWSEDNEVPAATDSIADQLKAISEDNENDIANATQTDSVAFILTASDKPPFPEDDEFVTHKELNEFDPVSRVEAAAANATIDAALGRVENQVIRHGGRIAQISSAMQELERRTRVTIVINDAVTNEEYEIEGLHHRQLADVIKIMTVEHCLMVGGAGAGKGEIAYQTAEALDIPFYTLDQGSLSPQTPVSAIIGYMNSAGNYVGTTFRQAFEHGGLIFLDELDNAQPACLATVNAALAIREGQPLGFPGGQMVKRHKDFKVLAAANTFGRGPDRTYAARQRGDAATWDRFTILALDYDNGLEDVLCRRTGIDEETFVKVIRYVRGLRNNVKQHQLPVVIGMRASIGMCKLIQAGLTPEQAIASRCRRGVSDADWAKMEQGCHFFPQPDPKPKPVKPNPTIATTPPFLKPASRPHLQVPSIAGNNLDLPANGSIFGNLKRSTAGKIAGEYIIRTNTEQATDGTGPVPGYKDTPIQVNPEIIDLIAGNKKIQAIKTLRLGHRISLVYAKKIVDMISHDLQNFKPTEFYSTDPKPWQWVNTDPPQLPPGQSPNFPTWNPGEPS